MGAEAVYVTVAGDTRSTTPTSFSPQQGSSTIVRAVLIREFPRQGDRAIDPAADILSAAVSQE
jgi:hypothetical protein